MSGSWKGRPEGKGEVKGDRRKREGEGEGRWGVAKDAYSRE